MVTRVHRVLLRVWRRVPRRLRLWAVRTASPSFTVGAACVIQRGDGSILLVRLSYRNGWGLPGGLIKRREEAADCARREVAEEIGVDVDLVGAPAVVVDSHPQRVDVVYRARLAAAVDGEGVRPRSVEVVEARWFPASELPVLQHEAAGALEALAASAVPPGTSAGDGDAAATLRRAGAQAAAQRRTPQRRGGQRGLAPADGRRQG